MVVHDDTNLQKNLLIKRLLHYCIMNKRVHNLIKIMLNREELMKLQVYC